MISNTTKLKIFKEIHRFLFNSIGMLAIIAILSGMFSFASYALGYIVGK